MIVFDDDIIYPPDYARRLSMCLARAQGQAVVGVHGRIFMPPHESYVSNAYSFHFKRAVTKNLHVHEVGIGTCAFVSSLFDMDVARWPSTEMDDIIFSIEAQKRSIPRIVIARGENWLQAQAEGQPDSLWRKTQRDQTVQSNLMRQLLKLY